MAFKTLNVEQKIISILKVLQSFQKPVGARVIAKKLQDHGINLSERAVRYHLKILDERGLTELAGRINGRRITQSGINEIKNARARDKVGFAISRIELLASCKCIAFF
jgi:repressor of nif and glnA expression